MSGSSPNPAPQPAPGGSPSPRRRPRLLSYALPFIPVVLAVGIALAIRASAKTRPPATTTSPQIGDLAPDFTLQDARKQPDAPPISLSRTLQKGPVILVFHRGLGCHFCYAFLTQIAEQIDDFNKAGLQVLALSADPMGAAENPDFPFPLLWDSNDDIAYAYDLFDADGSLRYGVFIIDQDRRIRFAARTSYPMSEALPAFLDEGRKLQHP
jgi:peroxiredoxin